MPTLLFVALQSPAHAGSVACTPQAGYTSCTRITNSGADQTFTVPPNTTSIDVKVWGGAGGGTTSSYYTNQSGGAGGGFATATVAVAPGQSLTLVVGSGGALNSAVSSYGGGGAGGTTAAATLQGGGSGGGMSAIFGSAIKSAANVLVVAGGGGGSSPGADFNTPGAGGGGGATGGADAVASQSGRGGTQAAGGAAATGTSTCTVAQTSGAQFQGGIGGSSNSGTNEGGGGGGGGYFGGGGGVCQGVTGAQNGGGGGGSGFTGGTGVTAGAMANGANFLYANTACSGTANSGGAADALYTAGVGQGSCFAKGGNGEIIIQSKAPVIRTNKISVGGTSTFSFSGVANLAATPANITTATAGTAAPASPTEIFASASNTLTSVTEAGLAGYTLTAASCTDANSATTGNTGALGTLSGNTLSIPAAIIKISANLTCTFTNTRSATVQIAKSTTGGVGTFSFSGTNGYGSDTITTITAGTAVNGIVKTLTTAATATTLTETIPTGWTATAGTCTGTAAGNVTFNGSATVTTATIVLNTTATAAGNALVCTFTNTKLPTVTLTKISNGGVGGFTFTGSNGLNSQTITTTTAGTGLAGATQTLTAAATSTTITEAVAAGYVLSGASCSGLGTGGTASLAGNVLTLDAAATAAGSAIVCIFTNDKKPTLALTKISNGGVGPFTFTGGNGWASQTITTATSGTGVTGATQTLTTPAFATTITEAVPAGYALASATCTGMGTGGTATPNLATGALALDAAATAIGSAIACTFTNTVKIIATNDDFTSTPINVTQGAVASSTPTVFTNDTLGGVQVTSSTVTATITNAGGLTGLVINADGTITVPTNSNDPGTYAVTYQICSVAVPANCATATATIITTVAAPTGVAQCVGTNLATNGGFETPSIPAVSFQQTTPGTVTGWTTTDTSIEQWSTGYQSVPAYTGSQFAEMNANVAGTLTRSVIPIHSRAELNIYWAHRARKIGPVVAYLVITDNGGLNSNYGNFSDGIANWGTYNSNVIATPTAATANLAFTAISSGFGDVSVGNFLDGVELCQTYITLTKAFVSKTDVDGSGADSVGDNITYKYTITNPANNNKSLTSVQIIDDKIGTLSVTPISGDTNGNSKLDPGETWVFNATYTLTQAVIDAGGVTNTAYAQGNTGINTIRSDNAAVTVPLTAPARVTLTKISSSGVGAFSFTGTNGFGSQSITTTTSGTGVAGATKILNVTNTVTTITETIPSGYALASATCTGMGTGSTATPNLSTGALVLDSAATASGTNIACTFTNLKVAPNLSIIKMASTTPSGGFKLGDTITYTYTITNTGNVPMSSVTVTDVHNGSGTLAGPLNSTLVTDVAPVGDSTNVSGNSNSWDVLGPGDTITFISTYIVTQHDIDYLF